MRGFMQGVKLYLVLAVNGQGEILARGQARVEEASDLAEIFLNAKWDDKVGETDKVDVVKIFDPVTREEYMTVSRKTDKRTGKVYPSYQVVPLDRSLVSI